MKNLFNDFKIELTDKQAELFDKSFIIFTSLQYLLHLNIVYHHRDVFTSKIKIYFIILAQEASLYRVSIP